MKERYYFERNEDGTPTGVTVCTLLKGENKFPGFAFCHPGSTQKLEFLDHKDRYVYQEVQTIEPDEFNKTAGKGCAYSRALKLQKLVDEGVPPADAMKTIYSGRMLRRIFEFQERRTATT